MTGLQFHLRDPENLDEKLAQVETKLSRSILRSAVRLGANVIRDAARSGAPVRSGALRRNIRTVLRRGKPGLTVASVGVMSSSGSRLKGKGRWPYYASFVERGHRIVPRRGKGQRAGGTGKGGGFVAARPFLLPALVSNQREVQRVVMEEIASRLGELVR